MLSGGEWKGEIYLAALFRSISRKLTFVTEESTTIGVGRVFLRLAIWDSLCACCSCCFWKEEIWLNRETVEVVAILCISNSKEGRRAVVLR